MKKSLGCQDMGVSSCSFEASSENKDQVIDALFAHAQKYHTDEVANLTKQQQDEMKQKMEDMMRLVSV
jgi:predicted small metal-binding protein